MTANQIALANQRENVRHNVHQEEYNRQNIQLGYVSAANQAQQNALRAAEINNNYLIAVEKNKLEKQRIGDTAWYNIRSLEETRRHNEELEAIERGGNVVKALPAIGSFVAKVAPLFG